MALFTQRVGKIFFHLRALLRRQYLWFSFEHIASFYRHAERR